MLLNRYYLMRHGESQANLANIIISLPRNGLDSYGLSEYGVEQVKESVSKSRLNSSVLIVTSDFLRTKETAALVSEVLGAEPARLNQGLRERGFGDFEEKSSDFYSKVWEEDTKSSEHTSSGVESGLSVTNRMLRVVAELEQSFKGRNILLVSHGDPLRFLQLAIRDRPLTEHLKIAMFGPAEIRPLAGGSIWI